VRASERRTECERREGRQSTLSQVAGAGASSESGHFQAFYPKRTVNDGLVLPYKWASTWLNERRSRTVVFGGLRYQVDFLGFVFSSARSEPPPAGRQVSKEGRHRRTKARVRARLARGTSRVGDDGVGYRTTG
jgi:hypothetical protein